MFDPPSLCSPSFLAYVMNIEPPHAIPLWVIVQGSLLWGFRNYSLVHIQELQVVGNRY